MIDQTAEATEREAVIAAAGAALALGGLGGLGRGDRRDPGLLGCNTIVVVEQDRRPGLPQVPFDVLAFP